MLAAERNRDAHQPIAAPGAHPSTSVGSKTRADSTASSIRWCAIRLCGARRKTCCARCQVWARCWGPSPPHTSRGSEGRL
jgi:hypothetical protein